MSLETPEKIRTLQRKLYRKAKAEPAFRFYLLYDKIYREDILRHAYALARANAGAPGVDGVTFEEIEAAGVEEWLAGLREELRREDVPAGAGATGDDPEAGRRRAAARHPDDPGPGGADRRQAGAGADLRGGLRGQCLWLSAADAAATDAIKEVHRLLCRGYTDVVDADLSKYFDTIPHADLLQSVARRIVDRHVLRLIKLWLKSAGRGAGWRREAAHERGQEQHARHAAGRGRQSAARQSST